MKPRPAARAAAMLLLLWPSLLVGVSLPVAAADFQVTTPNGKAPFVINGVASNPTLTGGTCAPTPQLATMNSQPLERL